MSDSEKFSSTVVEAPSLEATIDPLPVDVQPRDPKGRFAPGHAVNETHGAIRLQRHGPTPEVAAEMAQHRAQCLADLGGIEEMSTIKLRLLDHYIALSQMIVLLGEYLIGAGPLTPRGRQRSSVSTLLSCIAAHQKLATTLGLERKAKRVQSVMDVLNAEDRDAE